MGVLNVPFLVGSEFGYISCTIKINSLGKASKACSPGEIVKLIIELSKNKTPRI